RRTTCSTEFRNRRPYAAAEFLCLGHVGPASAACVDQAGPVQLVLHPGVCCPLAGALAHAAVDPGRIVGLRRASVTLPDRTADQRDRHVDCPTAERAVASSGRSAGACCVG